jgi:hypothetical protein
MDKEKTTYNSVNPLQDALENEIARCSEEGFTLAAKSLAGALKLLKKAEAEEYDQWRIEQGAVATGWN